ncbi:MAG TPA: VWA domain-containing protein [Gemmatimonadales bacterium]|nr:VWA domain-containing protein [Gemmatimonadales bacterium]
MSFARPLLLALLLLPLWLLWRARKGAAVTVGDGGIAAAAAGRAWVPWIPPVLRAAALAAFVVAATGPRIAGSGSPIRRDGISIVIALDVSSSMLAEDFAPSNRFEVAKRQAVAFVRGRPNDRIGLVGFAGEALTLIPVTLDHAVLEAAVTGLRIGTLEDGTAIGSGLAIAVNRLRRLPGRSKVILLLTDGVNNRGAVDPATAADLAATFGIRVYTVGIGSQGEARIPTGRSLTGFTYETLPVDLDEPLLREIAGKAGGEYFRATDAGSLGRIFQRIDEMERTRMETRQARWLDEQPEPFLIAGLGFLALALGLGATVAVRSP